MHRLKKQNKKVKENQIKKFLIKIENQMNK